MGRDIKKIKSSLCIMNEAELRLELDGLLSDYVELQAASEANERIALQMIQDYQDLKASFDRIQAENKALSEENGRLLSQVHLRKNDLFGRKTEKLRDVLDGRLVDESLENPVTEDADASDGTDDNCQNAPCGSRTSEDILGKKTRHVYGKRTRGTRKKDLEKLAEKIERIYDPLTYDTKYGEGNWSVIKWKEHVTVERIPATVYKRIVYTPVLLIRSTGSLVNIPSPYKKLLPGSILSSSLLAGIIYDKVALSLPTYRQEQDYLRNGIVLRRSTMCRWISDVASFLFYPVYTFMADKIRQDQYNQCDETVTQVIDDGRGANSKCFVWVHTTGELSEFPQIILFCFELTRSADHLREFYEKTGYSGTLTSDAYQVYPLLEKETSGEVAITGCFMHCRRRFSEALRVLKLSEISNEGILELPEVKAQKMITEIYQAETPLKALPAEERGIRRNKEVKPLVECFLQYIHELEKTTEQKSDRLVKAISYTLNQEKYLTRFLEDPNIPIDNGFVERSIRPYAVGRGNWKFNFSKEGAEANVIAYTLVETAKANSAHPYYYLKYLLEEMPLHMDQPNSDRDYLEDMMPWSKRYREYEENEKKKTMDIFTGQSPPDYNKSSWEKDDLAKPPDITAA